MKVKVIFFATLRDLVGMRELQIFVDGSTISTVRHALIRLYPDLESHFRIALCALNEEFAFGEEVIKDGDTIAFFPPVSGGEEDLPTVCLLPHEPFDYNAVIEKISTPKTGAIVLFSGLVRGETEREGYIPRTDYLEYEAYETMALSKMSQVISEIRGKWHKIIGIAVVQRLGKLVVGDNTVLIACSAAHRDDGCFEGARYGIDRLKEIVPVWKKEVMSTDSKWVTGSYFPTEHDRNT